MQWMNVHSIQERHERQLAATFDPAMPSTLRWTPEQVEAVESVVQEMETLHDVRRNRPPTMTATTIQLHLQLQEPNDLHCKSGKGIDIQLLTMLDPALMFAHDYDESDRNYYAQEYTVVKQRRTSA